MKTLTPKQIKAIKNIAAWNNTKFHGNRKQVNGLPVDLFTEIVEKKRERGARQIDSNYTDIGQLVRKLFEQSKQSVGSPYFKTLIEGATGIYYASPIYGHRDYNKTRIFNKNPKTIKILQIFNSYFDRKIEEIKNQ